MKINNLTAIIFIGSQASGKTSFYMQNFVKTHIRISLDMLHTRNKEWQLINTCLQMPHSFVVDNTNPTKEERAKYIQQAKAAELQIIGYYFQSKINDCIQRNNLREGKEKIPEIGIRSTQAKLELPNYDEGFDKLFYVKIVDNEFIVTKYIS